MDTSRKLSEEEVHNLINELLSSERIEYIEEYKEFIVFKVPTSSEMIYADCIEKQTLEQALKQGCVSEDNLPEEFSHTFFSVEDAEALNELETKIEGYKLLLSKRIKGTDLYKRDVDKLKELEEKKDLLLLKKSEASQYTAEYVAKEEKILTLLSLSALDLERRKKWSSKEELLDRRSVSYVYTLLNKFLSFYWGPEVSTIRQIARSGEWRNIYLSAMKANIDIFGKSIKDLSSVQIQLLSWSMYYQSVYDLPFSDRPSEDIINNDDSLDNYMEQLSKKLKAEEKSIGKNSAKFKNKASESDHVIVSAESQDYVRLNREGLFSDTAAISNRAKESDKTYSDVKDRQQQRNKIRKLNRK